MLKFKINAAFKSYNIFYFYLARIDFSLKRAEFLYEEIHLIKLTIEQILR